MNRILVILDRDPFPPCNGETIPAAAHVRALAERWPVDVACIGFQPRHPQALPVGVNWLPLGGPGRLSPLSRAVRQLRGELPQETPADPLELLSAAAGRRYALAYIPLLRLLPWLQAAKQSLGELKLVANVSDAPSEVLRRQWRLAATGGFGVKFRFGRVARGAALPYARHWEREAAATCDLLLVQSRNDRDAVTRAAPGCHDRVLVARNGVDESLFDARYQGGGSQRLLHLGPVRGERRDLLFWFVRHVFAPLRRRRPGAALDVVGSVGDRDKAALQRHEGVCCHGYVEPVRPLLEAAAVGVAPTMMRHGLVNKVAESLAAGLPCTGMGAFNGLPGFANGVHGIDVRSAVEWVEVLTDLLGDEARRRRLSAAGRALASSQLRWVGTSRLLQSRVAPWMEPAWRRAA